MSTKYDDKNLLETVFEDGEKSSGNGAAPENEFISEEIRNSAFKVRIAPVRLLANVAVLVIPCFAYYVAWPLLITFRTLGSTTFPDLFLMIMILIFVIGLALLFSNAGKGMIVSGRGIIIRRFFVFHDTIKADEVEECEVITGLSVYTRMGTQNFSKAVIRYGEGGKVSFNSNMYRGWREMVRYMELNGKVRYTDGRSAMQKNVDDILGRNK